MKRQNAASLDRIKRPGLATLTKPERMLCAQSKPVNEPLFGTVFAAFSEFRLRDMKASLALRAVVRAQFCREPCEKIMNIYIADCTIMSYLLGICRFTPALLIFMKFSKHSGENSDVKNQQIFRGWRE